MQYLVIQVSDEDYAAFRDLLEGTDLQADLITGQNEDYVRGPWLPPSTEQLQRARDCYRPGQAAWDRLSPEAQSEYYHEFIAPEEAEIIRNTLIKYDIVDHIP